MEKHMFKSPRGENHRLQYPKKRTDKFTSPSSNNMETCDKMLHQKTTIPGIYLEDHPS